MLEAFQILFKLPFNLQFNFIDFSVELTYKLDNLALLNVQVNKIV